MAYCTYHLIFFLQKDAYEWAAHCRLQFQVFVSWFNPHAQAPSAETQAGQENKDHIKIKLGVRTRTLAS
jgi:hypothetical protein